MGAGGVPVIVYSFALVQGQPFDGAELHYQVQSVFPGLLGIRRVGLALQMEFAGELTDPQIANIVAIVEAHSGAPAPLKLWRYVAAGDIGRDHRAIDFGVGLTTRLHEQVTVMFRGEVRQVGFFAPDNHTDEIVRETMVYVRSANGLAVSRTTTRTWFREDGTAHPVAKVTTKDYAADPVHQMQEGARRRQNVVDRLTIDVLGMLMATQTAGDVAAAETIGAGFMLTHSSAVTTYLRTGANALLQAEVTADTAAWLDNDLAALGMGGVTIRQAIVASLLGIME
jgi:hypothetical protein